MHYLIQENTFREQNYNLIFDTINKMGLPYNVVKIFPYIDKICDINDIPDYPYDVDDIPELKVDSEHIFIFGAIKLARISKQKNWYPGSLLNDNHNFEVYKNYYKSNLLNYNSLIVDVNDKLDWSSHRLFLRPTLDNKKFTGKAFTEDEWKSLLNNSDDFENFKIQVSTVKNIQKEIRFWVVGGKVITGSQYRLGNRVAYNALYDDDALKFAQDMVDIYQLAEAFVIDICLSDDEWKIVECGCINSAGFYLCDIQKLITSLEDYFG